MKSISFAFAVHNHQPNGNFDRVIEDAYRLSYKPFIDVLKKHPHVKFTQHYTGTLLEWLQNHHPGFVRELRLLVERGQLELLTGSYYEAILSIIPEEDRVGQIKKLSETIYRLFGSIPRGMWLAERVWEQSLVGSLVRGGVEFVMIDDTHFRHAGMDSEPLTGYYLTEDQGVPLKVVPIDKMLRYTIPFRAIEETRHYLQSVASDRGGHFVLHGDDGEKFGVWPKTHAEVYEKGWLESFCVFLEENSDWVRMVHLGECIDELQPAGRIYLPTASYVEMMKWVLPSTSFLQIERFERDLKEQGLFDDYGVFVRGGYWRNFLSKYPEANHMHKKMLRVARRLRVLESQGTVPDEIYDHLWAGQCNDPYWHGVFGGLYLPNLRFPVYHHLLRAESELDRLEQLPPLRVEATDFDCDGAEEVLVESERMNLYFTPAAGGSLIELDYKPAAINLLDIISRREEGYHRRLLATRATHMHTESGQEELVVKELGLEKHLHFDWYRHASLVDHFFGDETSLEAVQQCKFLELGDFVNQPYDVRVETTGDACQIVLVRRGAIWKDGSPHQLSVEKRIMFRSGDTSYTVDYELRNLEQTPVDLWFGVEFNVGLMAGDAHDRYYDIEGRPLTDRRLRSAGEERDVQSFRFVDEWLGIHSSFRSDRPATLWRCPIETVSLSEAGLERLFQSSMVILHWKFQLEKSISFHLEQSVGLLRQEEKKLSAVRHRRSAEA